MLRVLSYLLLAGAALGAEGEYPTQAIGSRAPDFALSGVDGKIHRLGDYASSKVLVVVFTCNHCPTAQLYEEAKISGRMTSLMEDGVRKILEGSTTLEEVVSLAKREDIVY